MTVNHYQLEWKTRILDLLIKSSKPLEQLSLDELKKTSEQYISPLMQRIFLGKKIPVYKIVAQGIRGRQVEIPIRLYYPSEETSLPLILFFHGGGWIYGNFDTHDRFCRRIAKDANAIVLAVRYRLAPFHQYPTALEDCYDALDWAIKNQTNLSIDPEKVIVVGDSAGGNLATALCIMARNLGKKWISQQVLIYPVVNGKLDLPSVEKNADAPVLSKSTMKYCIDCYARNETDILQSYFSPLLTLDLSHLPPALIITGEYDILQRLKLEQIDLYQLHRPDPKVPFSDSIGALKELRDQGKIRHLGLSNVSVEQIEEAHQIVPIVSVQNKYSISNRSFEDVLNYCTQNNIAFIPHGSLGAHPLKQGAPLANAEGVIADIAIKKGVKPNQIALAWLLHRAPNIILIPGTTTISHLEENMAASSITLTSEEMSQLNQANNS